MHTSSVAQILEPYEHLPKKIQQAILRVETHPYFLGLTKSMKAVLKVLLSKADQHDASKVIRLKAAAAAKKAEVSEKSVQRTIKALKSVGWLTQYGTGRQPTGEYGCRDYILSECLCQVVLLPYNGNSPAEDAVETRLSDGSIYDLNFKEDQRKIAQQRRLESQGAITLPPILESMAEHLNIKRSGICKLRGIAHDAGYQLEDVYVAIKHNLDRIALKATNAYNYVRAVVLNPRRRDFKAIRSQLERAQAGSRLSARAKRFSNKRYASVCGLTKVQVFEYSAEVVTPQGKIVMAVGASFEEVLDRIERGDFVLVESTNQIFNTSDVQQPGDAAGPRAPRSAMLEALSEMKKSLGIGAARRTPANTDVAIDHKTDEQKSQRTSQQQEAGSDNLADSKGTVDARTQMDNLKQLLAPYRSKIGRKRLTTAPDSVSGVLGHFSEMDAFSNVDTNARVTSTSLHHEA